jgi:hypothetical protein
LVELSPAERYKLERLKAEQAALAASLAAFDVPAAQGCASDGRAAPASGASRASQRCQRCRRIKMEMMRIFGASLKTALDMDRAAQMLRRIRQR